MADPDKPPPVGTALPGVLSDDDNTGAKRLSRVGVFRELSPRAVERVAQLVEERSVEAGTEIVRSGGTDRDLFLLERGTCAVRAGTDATVLARLGPGDVFGERALLTGEPRSATVVAETDVSLLVLAAQPFDRLRQEQPELNAALELVLASRREVRADFDNEAEVLLRFASAPGGHVIGRASDCAIVLNDASVSARHAELRVEDDTVRLHDLGSAAGIYHNRRRVQSAVLVDGDQVQLGTVQLFVAGGALQRFSPARGLRIEASALEARRTDGGAILHPTDFSVYPGELVGVVGASGAGKTTLLRCLLGLFPDAGGSVSYDSLPIPESIGLFRQTLGYLPQDDIIHLELSVEQTLRLSAGLRLPPDLSPAEVRRRSDQVLAQVGLTERRRARVGELSGGERKRAGVAVELLAQPRVLFLDEPTSGLDPGLDQDMMQILRALSNEGRTVILTTHATRNIHMCDRLAVLSDGYLVFFGTPTETLTFFGATEFVEVYHALAAQSAAALRERFEASMSYQVNVLARLITPIDEEPEAADARVVAPPSPRAALSRAHRFRHQTQLLLARNFRIALADRPTLALRLFAAPLIAGALLAVFDADIFALRRDEGGRALSAVTLLFVASGITLFLSASVAAVEITRERAIYQRERLLDLSPTAYVTAKVLLLAPFAALQSLSMALVLGAGTHLPSPAGENLALLFAALFVTALAGTGLGLLVSALSRNAEQAIMTSVLLLIPQLLFAGLILPLGDMSAVARQVAEFMPSKWSLELLGGLMDLEPRVEDQRRVFVGILGVIVAHPFDDAFIKPLIWRWGVLAAFATAFVGLTTLIQIRKGS